MKTTLWGPKVGEHVDPRSSASAGRADERQRRHLHSSRSGPPLWPFSPRRSRCSAIRQPVDARPANSVCHGRECFFILHLSPWQPGGRSPHTLHRPPEADGQRHAGAAPFKGEEKNGKRKMVEIHRQRSLGGNDFS